MLLTQHTPYPGLLLGNNAHPPTNRRPNDQPLVLGALFFFFFLLLQLLLCPPPLRTNRLGRGHARRGHRDPLARLPGVLDGPQPGPDGPGGGQLRGHADRGQRGPLCDGRTGRVDCAAFTCVCCGNLCESCNGVPSPSLSFSFIFGHLLGLLLTIINHPPPSSSASKGLQT